MTFNHEIEGFINDFVKDLNEGNASIFAGAGMSIPAGFVNWKELLAEIAEDLGLNIDSETDLVSLAQFHVNENKTKSKLTKKIIEEFSEHAEETENHRIISRLPISSVWTTNYDQLIERTFEKENKIVDVKYTTKQLLTSKPKRDVIIYKMHGDVDHASDTILTKEQYEQYHQTHEPFINTLTGELTTKTFLFIGFSFTDPNLDYILSRLNYRFQGDKRIHYCFLKRPQLGDSQNPDKATLDYNLRRQAFSINDLKRYGIKSLLLDNHSEITQILNEIENRYKKKTIFISGSAETYKPYSKNEAVGFVHSLSKLIIKNDFKIVNGFGWGIGSSVINGALEAIYENPKKYSETQLILKPFPQFASGGKELPELWEDYRQNMIAKCGISIFVFGNKLEGTDIENAKGVFREFEISSKNGNICIPIGITKYASKEIYSIMLNHRSDHPQIPDNIFEAIKELNEDTKDFDDTLMILERLIKQLKK